MKANDENKRKAQAYFQLANMVVRLLNKVTLHHQAPFVSEELRSGSQLQSTID